MPAILEKRLRDCTQAKKELQERYNFVLQQLRDTQDACSLLIERVTALEKEAVDMEDEVKNLVMDKTKLIDALKEAQAALEFACARNPTKGGFTPSEHLGLRVVRRALEDSVTLTIEEQSQFVAPTA